MTDVQADLLNPEHNGGVELAVSGTRLDPGSEALYREIKLSEALANYDVVSAGDTSSPYIVLADRDPGMDSFAATMELGFASPSPWTAWTRTEHVPELRDRNGLVQYYRMRRQDGIVRGAQNLLKTPPRAARWHVDPASRSKRDENIAKFVEDNLFEKLNVSWPKLLDDILLMCDYGYMIFEKVYQFDPDGRLRLRKLAPRHPLDVREWIYDAHGGPDGVLMESNSTLDPEHLGIYIPIEKIVIFSMEPEAGDLNGISFLRSVYKHWYYRETLFKIDAIQKERHGIGIPVIKLPLGWSADDKKLAENLGRNLRTNERAHVVLPPGWEIMFAQLEGQMVDCMKSVEYHDKAIMANVLGPFLKDPSAKEDSMQMFYKSTRYIADAITDIFNRHVIPQLVDFNFVLGPDRGYPKLRSRRIGEWEDVRTMTFAVRNLVGAGIIIPDDPLEEYMRHEIDMPPADKATSREVATPQGGPGAPQPSPAQPPRQAPAKAKPPAGNAGTDQSGG